MATLYDTRVLTQTVRNIRPPAQFLTNFLFPNRRTIENEKIELSYKEAGRKMAPMIKKNGEAVLVGGIGSRFAEIEFPNVRLKQVHYPHETFNRKAGMGIFTSRTEMERAQRQKVVDDLDDMLNSIVNREEWMVASLIQGAINYQVEDQENFTITLPRDPANTIDLGIGNYWDDDYTLARPEAVVRQAQRLTQSVEGVNITDIVCGTEAADAFIESLRQQNVMDQRRFDTGSLQLQNLEDSEGVTFLGRMFGVNWWEYSRQMDVPAEENGGVPGTFDLIRPKYIECFNRNQNRTDRAFWYGAIPDFGEQETRTLNIGQRFSKSWVEPDPSQRFLLVHSRPLPWMQRPNTYVSVKVVSG